MSPRTATISAADLNRVLRVARKNGAASVAVDVKPDGWQATIVLVDSGISVEKKTAKVASKVRTLL